MGSALLLFLGSLALSLMSSLVLAETVDRLGSHLGISEGLLGLLTALAADAPEISAALTALQGGRAALGFGVVLGSNLFNLAGLLGASAVVAGRVRIHRRALVWEGTVAMAVTVVVALVVLGPLPPAPALGLLAVTLVPYVGLASLRPRAAARLASRGGAAALLAGALTDASRDLRKAQMAPRATRHDVLTVVPALASVVLASVGMVHAAVTLGDRWHISDVLIGTLVLAGLTGIPNVIAAVRLALRHRGSAVVSESLNSNTINLVVGVALPAVVVGVAPGAGLPALTVWWLLAMTAGTLTLSGFRWGLRRAGGLAVMAAYVAFVVRLVVG